MANLFVGTNYYITDTYQDDNNYYVNTHFTDGDGEFTENKAYSFEKDSPITNVIVTPTGIVSEVHLVNGESCRMADGTYTDITHESTTGSGTGLTLTITADSVGPYTVAVADGGSGYEVSDTITLAYGSVSANTARPKPIYHISNTRPLAENYFPSGLAEVDLLSNAIPLVNSIISSGSE